MKKKFFTLLAAAAFLFGTAVPAFSAVPHTPFTSGSMVAGDATGMVVGANTGLYHITNVNPAGVPQGVLYVDNTGNTGAVTIESPLSSSKALMESLWCVEISVEAQGKNPSFSFLNKAYGDNLRAETIAVPTLSLDGPLADWNFSDVYGANIALETVQPLYSYINGNEAIVLVEGALPGEVATAIADVTEIETVASALGTTITTNLPGGITGTATLLYFTLSEAAPIVLNAAQFNTKLGVEPTATGQKLTFDPDRNVGSNPFTENVLHATDVAGGTAGTADWYLNLQNSANKYLRVDTAIVNATGSYFLTFKFTDAIEDNNPVTPNNVNLENQYQFRFVYFPSHDSLIINVKDALQPSKTLESGIPPVNYFREIAALPPTAAYGPNHNEGNLVSFDDVYNAAHTNLYDFTYVILQDLNNNKVVTVGELPSQTRISLGLGDCKPAVNKTSLEGLYTIKNAEGKYLQVPIYTDSVTRYPQWVTLEKNVDPFQMPSFQWVVQKIRSNDAENTSQITITNREYSVSVGTVQLWKDRGTTIFGADVAANAAGFTEVPKAQREDPYLGYKYVPEDITKLRTYTFNYLHDFDDSKYLSVKNDQRDSLLHVTSDADAFQLVPYHHNNGVTWSVEPVSYGTQPATWNTTKYAAQLVRTAYVLKIKEGNKLYNTNKIVKLDRDENRYVVTTGDANKNYIHLGDSAVFYLKTNNTKDGKNYYALVDTASLTNYTHIPGIPPMITTKAGVDDNNVFVKAQNHYEVRTSAFAVEPKDDPLYRRFNRLADGDYAGNDFYNEDGKNDIADTPDTLRFFRVNNDKEFLYEDANSVYSKGKGINFLGYKHAADFGIEGAALEERTAFFVDTAFVNRPAIQNSDIDTPKPQYLLGVGVKKVESETIPGGDCEPDVTTPFYVRGRYLINATDSVYGVGANWASNAVVNPATGAIHTTVANDKYIWDTRWERLAFVDAIHLYDTLYVLNGASYEDPVDFNKLRVDARVRAIRLDNNFHKDVVFSFRLIDSEQDVDYEDQVQNFLIESETTHRDIALGEMIAPMTGGWVKLQNGVPVISRGFYEQAITDAEKFNVVKTDADPVANEDVNAEAAVKVIAGNGTVTIYNAAGKTVAISNVLGQTVANAVVTSDIATIAAPKGIVVVAIQGEDAVKAIVK